MRVATPFTLLPGLLLVTISLTPAQAPPQTQASPGNSQPTAIARVDGGVSGAMESIFIPPLPAAPFSFTLVTEWSRPLANGGTFTLANQRRIARNLKGQIYQERWLLVPRGGRLKSTMTTIQIADPTQHTWLNCWVPTKSCELRPYSLLSDTVYKPAISPSGKFADGTGFHQHEDLGASRTAGVDTHGYRETSTLNPGAMGNDQPMITSREFWYAPSLGVNLISIVDDPQSGKQVFTATDLSTADPDPALFNPPEGFTVEDIRSQFK